MYCQSVRCFSFGLTLTLTPLTQSKEVNPRFSFFFFTLYILGAHLLDRRFDPDEELPLWLAGAAPRAQRRPSDRFGGQGRLRHGR